MASAGLAELVFVVDVSSLTAEGFIGTTRYEGKGVDLEFDDADKGVFLNSEMAGRLGVKKGSRLSLLVEDETTQVAAATVAAVGRSLRISNSSVFYGVGKQGGAIIRIRKAAGREPG